MKLPFATTRSPGALPGLDRAYQQQLAELRLVRRAVAAAATAQKQLELQLRQLTERATGDHGEISRPGSDPQLETLRHRYSAAQEETQRLFAASRRLQLKIDAFRMAKEATEAAYVEAQDAVHATRAEVGATCECALDRTEAASHVSVSNRPGPPVALPGGRATPPT